jgi:hypothetical protein
MEKNLYIFILSFMSLLRHEATLFLLNLLQITGHYCIMHIAQCKLHNVSSDPLGFLVLSCRCILPEILRPEPWPRVAPSIQSHSPLCIPEQTTDCYWSKESFIPFIGFTRDTRHRDRGKRPVLTHLCNVLTYFNYRRPIDRTLCQPQVKLNQYFFFKNSTTVKHN